MKVVIVGGVVAVLLPLPASAVWMNTPRSS